MKIKFSEIPEDGLRLQISDESWFPEHEIERCGSVHANVHLQRSEQRLFMEGVIETTVKLHCDRCLEAFCRPLISQFKVDIELVKNLPATTEHVCGREEMDMLFVDKPMIDIFQVLSQQVFLSLSVKKLCREDCAGLCVSCGANLNVEKCGCGSGGENNPFSVLAGLKS
jgi:uncharacterized protein